MKQILVATDGSPSAQEAIEVGLELAKEQGADVTFVHVTDPDEYRGGKGRGATRSRTPSRSTTRRSCSRPLRRRRRRPGSRTRSSASPGRPSRVDRRGRGRERRRPDRGRLARPQCRRHRAARQHLARGAPPRQAARARRQGREGARRGDRLSALRRRRGRLRRPGVPTGLGRAHVQPEGRVLVAHEAHVGRHAEHPAVEAEREVEERARVAAGEEEDERPR